MPNSREDLLIRSKNDNLRLEKVLAEMSSILIAIMQVLLVC